MNDIMLLHAKVANII